jgi:FkbM family methyltransferase
MLSDESAQEAKSFRLQNMDSRVLPLPAAAHSQLLSDLVTTYIRRAKHRGQLRIINGLEHLIGRRRWNVMTSHGFRVSVDITDLVQKVIMDTGHWDLEVGSALERRWSATDTFMDIGANIGFFTLFALRRGLQHVTAFEPMPELADLLVANVAANNFPRSRLTMARVALGSSSGTANYRAGPRENSGQGRIDLSAKSDSNFKVPITTLDAYLAANPAHRPTIMKLDVEGYELDVLQGASNLLMTCAPHTIVFEADADNNLTIRDQRITQLLQQAGYAVKPVDTGLLDTKANFVALLQ